MPISPDTDGPDVEQYAAWQPDLIIANGNVGDYYEPVRKVGPVVHLPETDWKGTVKLVGQIFEKPEVAAKITADTTAMIDGARLDEPITAAIVSPYQENGTVGTQVIGSEFANFLDSLNVKVADSESAEDGYEDVSLERLGDRLEGVDHVIVFNNGAELRDRFLANPVVAKIPVFAEGRVTKLTRTESNAVFPVNPMTVPVVLEGLAPVLATSG